MKIATATVQFYLPWSHSLKEKRAEIKGLVQKLQREFGASVAEIGAQDLHQTALVGFAKIVQDTASGDRTIDHMLEYIARMSQAEVTQVMREMR